MMEMTQINKNNTEIAVVRSRTPLITDMQSALDLLMNVRYDMNCDQLMIEKSAMGERFFDLKTGIAGEVLQKFVNYRVKLAIVGDFSEYTSKSLRDFIRESNKGNNIFFLPTMEMAANKLSQ